MFSWLTCSSLYYIISPEFVLQKLCGENLKKAIAKLVVQQNLPFAVVESDSFIELLCLCNPNVKDILVKADAIRDFILQLYSFNKSQIKDLFSPIDSISLTCDLWTSPNTKAILALTGHWINKDWELKEILIDVVEVLGQHTGVNIASYVVKSLDEFGITDKIFCLTGDNASNNKTLAKELENFIPSFTEKENRLGCTGHVFNLAAGAGLKALGHQPAELIIEEDDDALETEDCDVNWGEKVDIGSEDEELFDPKSIVNRIRCLSKKIRVSPQLRHTFESNVKVCYDLEPTPSSQSPTTLPASSPSTTQDSSSPLQLSPVVPVSTVSPVRPVPESTDLPGHSTSSGQVRDKRRTSKAGPEPQPTRPLSKRYVIISCIILVALRFYFRIHNCIFDFKTRDFKTSS